MTWLQITCLDFAFYLVPLSLCFLASEASLWILKHAEIIPFARRTAFPELHDSSFLLHFILYFSVTRSGEAFPNHLAIEHPLSISLPSFPPPPAPRASISIWSLFICLLSFPLYQIFSSMRTGALSTNVGWMEICSIKY